MNVDRNLFRIRTLARQFSDALRLIAETGPNAKFKFHIVNASHDLLSAGQRLTYAIAAAAPDGPGGAVPSVPMSPGEYLRDCRVAAGLSVADVAVRIATVPRLGEIDRQEMVRAIEADASTATIHTLAALREVFAFSIEEVSRLIDVDCGRCELREDLQDAAPDDFCAAVARPC